MAFFAVGDRYRDTYEIEAVFPFFDGEVAIARSKDQWFLLQHAHLKKQAPSRAIQQYRSLDHPLILPYREVYTEERSLVFIRPYEPYQPLYDAIRQQPASEDELVRWGKSLLHMEAYLRSKPLPMYFILDPRNVGLTADGKLIVLYCGLRQITALEPSLDWGTFFHILLTGEMREEPLDKISSDAPFSKPMIRLLQKSLHNQSVDSVLSQIEAYERKKNGKGLLDRLFGDQAEKEQPQVISSRTIVPTLVPSSWKEAAERERLERERQEREAAERERLERERQEREAAERERQERERQEREAAERERLERERQEREAAERERLERERREREAAERERQERERQEREAAERERLERERQEREAAERERQERERQEREAAERERLERERQEREAAERERLERERREREAAERERLERERQEREAAERERLERERQEREAAERERQERERLARERLRQERLERERQEHEKLAKQFQEYIEAFYKSS